MEGEECGGEEVLWGQDLCGVLVAGECGVWCEEVGVEMVEGQGVNAEEVMYRTT